MKRILAFVTAVLMAATLSVSAFAAVSTVGTIKDVDTKNFQAILKDNADKQKMVQYNKTAINYATMANLPTTADSEVRVYLTGNMFVDNAGGKISATASHVTRTQVRNGRIALRRSNSRNSKVIQEVALKYDNVGSYVSIKFVEQYASLSDLDYSITLYLTVNGERRPETTITVAGTMSADVLPVYADDDYVDLSGGRIAEAAERVNNVEVDLGNGMSIFTSMFQNRKYYATCTTDATNADMRVINRYPGIASVYTVKTINMKQSGKPVQFNLNDTFYVYGSDGKYLGTTESRLPYFTKYYLSEKKYASITIA